MDTAHRVLGDAASYRRLLLRMADDPLTDQRLHHEIIQFFEGNVENRLDGAMGSGLCRHGRAGSYHF